MGAGFGIAIQQDGASGGGESDAAQHFAFTAASVEQGVGGEIGKRGTDTVDEAAEDEAHDGVAAIVSLLAEQFTV